MYVNLDRKRQCFDPSVCRARRMAEWLLLLVSSSLLVVARVSRTFALGAQTILGCLIAKSFNAGLLSVLAVHWPILIGLAAATLIMTAAQHGADKRVVALMQYSRIILVAFAAVAVARVLGHPGGSSNLLAPGGGQTFWSLPLHELGFLEAIALALAGALCVKLTGQSSAALFVPAFGGAAVQAAGLITIELPPLVPALAFGVIGWYELANTAR
jgi:uncharacterized membrane protein AbrB (regulator of aidB expression)